jgi:hypothetical protein
MNREASGCGLTYRAVSRVGPWGCERVVGQVRAGAGPRVARDRAAGRRSPPGPPLGAPRGRRSSGAGIPRAQSPFSPGRAGCSLALAHLKVLILFRSRHVDPEGKIASSYCKATQVPGGAIHAGRLDGVLSAVEHKVVVACAAESR